ncbi:hypothetical protein PR202_ga11961 [Eleusine coracana subsp. coracana]|uniref:Pectinesterase inhibitor domain-containing protein n=1 Tax=Eleusine coracana subsp. coracana TaxID=191504 RepID=A0AAV5CAD5_ELECO|nr:hypothetical protein QOZ80_5AG0396780 [Eleusine coracana subsp. coracana]GJM95249.1 hypothetical protein PR202_ga11961 [Eleusine coracana subsp. coracana]
MSKTSLLVLVTIAAAALCSGGAAAAGVDTVADSCAAIRNFVDAGFCVSRLRSVPGAAFPDRHAHLLTAASGASAHDAATSMARDYAHPVTRVSLEACRLLYGFGSVPALRLLRQYAAARSWAAAKSLLPLTSHARIGCDAALPSDTDGGEDGRGQPRVQPARYHGHRVAQCHHTDR